MAVQDPGLDLGFVTAGADLSGSQYLAVKITGAAAVGLCGAGENSLGILQNDPGNGEAASVRFVGPSKAVYGGAVGAGDRLTPDANGKLVATSATTDHIVGVAVIGGQADDVGSILVTLAGQRQTT